MAASSRPALAEKDVNAPLATSKQSLVKTTAATHPTPPKQPWPQRRTPQTLNADFLSTNQRQGRDDAMATSENSSQAVASGQPPPEAGLTHDAMIDVVGADANEVAESITVESGRAFSAKRARGDSADTNQGQAHSSTRRRLASPFSEDVTPSVTQSQPMPLTQEQLSATPQHGHLVRSFSVSPTLVDRASKPSAADLLRTRLRYAMFKVQTSQTTAPLSSVELAALLETPKRKLVIQDPPEKLQRAFERAQGRSRSSRPKSTGNTPRYPLARVGSEAAGKNHEASGHLRTSANMPQSAPTELAEEPDDGDADSFSVNMNRAMTPASISSCGSCSDKEQDEEEAGLEPEERVYGTIMAQERDLTSSAVKDRAADSLLQLGGDGF